MSPPHLIMEALKILGELKTKGLLIVEDGREWART